MTQSHPNSKADFYKTFAITWIAYAGFYLTRRSLAVAKIGLTQADAFGGASLTHYHFAWIDGWFLALYTLGQFAWGPLADHYGTKKVVLIGMGCSILTALFAGLSSSIFFFTLFNALQGLFQSAGWGPLCQSMGAWTSPRTRGTVMALWSTNYALGSFIATLFAGLMAGQYFFDNWRYAYLFPSAVFSVVMFLFYLFHQEAPSETNAQEMKLSNSSWAARKPLSHILQGYREVLPLGMAYFLLKPARYALLFWGPKYIYDTFGSDVTTSSLVASMFELAGPIGAFSAGWFSDQLFLGRRIPICVLYLSLLAGLLLLMPMISAFGSYSMILLFFLIGVVTFGPDAILSSTAALEFGSDSHRASAVGFVNGLGSVGAIAGGSLPGILSELWGWSAVFFCLASFALASAAVLLPYWHTRPQPQVQLV